MALLSDNLQHFECLQSEDEVKTDLELTCTRCGEVICDVEHGDNLKVLATTADAHECEDDGDEDEDDFEYRPTGHRGCGDCGAPPNSYHAGNCEVGR